MIPPHVLICIFLFDRLVGGGFLILRGCCAVRLGPERLGLMVYSLAPVGTRRFFFTIASPACSLLPRR